MLSLQPYDIMITHTTRHVKRTKAKSETQPFLDNKTKEEQRVEITTQMLFLKMV